tara:strand:+ start:430 stop:618 length:189 start_codon:yes stop_codon:yes gene_type:complete
MSASTHGGKGDRQRKADTKKFNSNWDLIFKEKKDDNESQENNNRVIKQSNQLDGERSNSNEK